jgi:hypothetical protein
MFKLPDSYYEKQKEVFNKKYITYNNQEIHVSELPYRSVTSEMKKDMRMNSYAQDDLPPKLTTEALIDTATYYLSHCTKPRFPCVTYDEGLINTLVPELIKRLEESEENMNILKRVTVNKLAMDLEHALINTQYVDPDTSVYDFLDSLKDMNR